MDFRHGGDRYTNNCRLDFSANINPLGMPEGVKAAVNASLDQCMFYADAEQTKLRRKLADYYDRHGVSISEDCFWCGAGAADLIYNYVRALKPKKAMLFTPCFSEYEKALCAVGAEVVFAPAAGFGGGSRLFEIPEDVEMIILTNPNNPDGFFADPVRIRELAAVCAQKKIHLLVDECFLWFTASSAITEFDASDFLANEYLSAVNAFTKIFAIPGLRFGYLITANQRVLDGIREVSQPWSVSVPAEEAAYACMEEDEFLIRTKEYIAKERKWLECALSEEGFTVYRSEANYILFQEDGYTDLKAKLLEKGILIRDCSNYRGLAKGFYRIAVKSHEDNIELLSAILEIRNRE